MALTIPMMNDTLRHNTIWSGLSPALRNAGLAFFALLLSSCSIANASRIDRSKLELSFAEEFDKKPDFWHATKNPKGRWKTNYYFSFQDTNHPKGWEPRTLEPNKELEYYGDPYEGMNPFEWKDGILDIVARPNPYKNDPRTHGLPYLSGVITTEKSLNQEYGYFEARIAIPLGQGIWPAFWLLPTPIMREDGWPQGRGHQEIDIMEVIKGEQGNVRVTAITDENGEKVPNQEAIQTGQDLTQFHTYGVLLTKEEIVWYFDNEEIRRIPNKDFHFPAYMLLNLAIGGDWAGYPDASTKFPATMRIDWVRAYRLK